MLHLFNKVYLEFDDRIENHLDRVVISQQYGDQMYELLEKAVLGKLILYGKTFEDVIGDGLVTRFKYTNVAKEDFGLTNEEILLLEDKKLNQIVSLK